MNISRTSRFAAITGIASAFLSACASMDADQTPLVAPALTVESRHHVGTAVTGPLPVIASATDAEALPLGVLQRALWVEAPLRTSDSLGPHVALVVGPNEADPLRAIAQFAGDVGYARGEDARRLLDEIGAGAHGRTIAAWRESWALTERTTTRVEVDTRFALPRIHELVFDATRAESSDAAGIALQIGSESELELLVLTEPLRPADGPIALVFSRAAGRDEPAALVVVLEAVDDPTPEDARSAADAALEASAANTVERRRKVTRSEAEAREIQSVVAQLDRPSERRARLVFLADSCAAPLALDLAMIARDEDLAKFAQLVKEALAQPMDGAQAGWAVERTAWLMLGRASAAGPIAPELSGVLTRQGGEAVRFPGAIEDLMRGVEDRDAWTKKLATENRILLEDAAPASRSRAYDWLAARGLEPANFDPFGTLAARRAALDAMSDAAESDAKTLEKRP